MSPLFSQPAFQLYVAASAILAVTLFGLALWTGVTRSEKKRVVNPEDVKVYAGASLAEVDHPDVQRVKRAHLNLIENAVPFFVIGLLYSLTDPSLLLVRILFFSFVAVRLLHAFFYLTARQPLRGASFMLGVLVNFVMLVQVVRAVL